MATCAPVDRLLEGFGEGLDDDVGLALECVVGAALVVEEMVEIELVVEEMVGIELVVAERVGVTVLSTRKHWVMV